MFVLFGVRRYRVSLGWPLWLVDVEGAVVVQGEPGFWLGVLYFGCTLGYYDTCLMLKCLILCVVES